MKQLNLLGKPRREVPRVNLLGEVRKHRREVPRVNLLGELWKSPYERRMQRLKESRVIKFKRPAKYQTEEGT